MNMNAAITLGLKRIFHCYRVPICLDNRFYGSIHEPPYLEALKPKYPTFPPLNVQLRGYDFAVLESFGQRVHKTATELGLNVSTCWASPAQHTKVTRLAPGKGAVVEAEYALKLYERNVQITDMPTITAAILIEAIQVDMPAGVKLSIHPHQPEHEIVRYVPDLELKALKKELDDLNLPVDLRPIKRKTASFRSKTSFKRKSNVKLSEIFKSNS